MWCSRVSKTMTDAFEVAGDFSPAEFSPNNTAVHTASDMQSAADTAVPAGVDDAADLPEVPNGFVTLGLAPELIRAVKDLGYTQPTTVQNKVIPLALPSETADVQVKNTST